MQSLTLESNYVRPNPAFERTHSGMPVLPVINIPGQNRPAYARRSTQTLGALRIR